MSSSDTLKQKLSGCQGEDNHAVAKHDSNKAETKEKVCGEHMKKEVRSFYERDNLSRITTSKNEPITKQTIKKHRRLLCETLKMVYLNYVQGRTCTHVALA